MFNNISPPSSPDWYNKFYLLPSNVKSDSPFNVPLPLAVVILVSPSFDMAGDRFEAVDANEALNACVAYEAVPIKAPVSEPVMLTEAVTRVAVKIATSSVLVPGL